MKRALIAWKATLGGVFAILAIVLGFLFLVLMYFLVSQSQDSVAAEQTAEEDRRMVRKIDTGFVQAITNIGTGLYTNYLPTLFIRA